MAGWRRCWAGDAELLESAWLWRMLVAGEAAGAFVFLGRKRREQGLFLGGGGGSGVADQAGGAQQRAAVLACVVWWCQGRASPLPSPHPNTRTALPSHNLLPEGLPWCTTTIRECVRVCRVLCLFFSFECSSARERGVVLSGSLVRARARPPHSVRTRSRGKERGQRSPPARPPLAMFVWVLLFRSESMSGLGSTTHHATQPSHSHTHHHRHIAPAVESERSERALTATTTVFPKVVCVRVCLVLNKSARAKQRRANKIGASPYASPKTCSPSS